MVPCTRSPMFKSQSQSQLLLCRIESPRNHTANLIPGHPLPTLTWKKNFVINLCYTRMSSLRGASLCLEVQADRHRPCRRNVNHKTAKSPVIRSTDNCLICPPNTYLRIISHVLLLTGQHLAARINAAAAFRRNLVSTIVGTCFVIITTIIVLIQHL